MCKTLRKELSSSGGKTVPKRNRIAKKKKKKSNEDLIFTKFLKLVFNSLKLSLTNLSVYS